MLLIRQYFFKFNWFKCGLSVEIGKNFCLSTAGIYSSNLPRKGVHMLQVTVKHELLLDLPKYCCLV